MNAGGGCEAFVMALKRCGWVKFTECGKLLYGMRFLQKLVVDYLQVLCRTSNTVLNRSMVPERELGIL